MNGPLHLPELDPVPHQPGTNPYSLTDATQAANNRELVRRLDELMRRCREDRHQVIYRDLLEVRGLE